MQASILDFSVYPIETFMDRLYTSDDLKVPKSCLKVPRDCRTDSPLETNDPGWIQFFSKTHQRPYWKNKTGDTTYNNPFSSKFIPLETCTGKRKNESSVVDPVKESQLEVDLLCIACQDLVIDAMQITCCGSLFCRGCITPWITDHGSCPCCRKAITIADIFCDIRSERKSANHPRACKLKDRGCKFIGDRQESVLHENLCEYIPVAPLRKKIADLTAELNEAAAERIVSAARIEAAEQQIEAFAAEKARTEAAHKQALQAAVWAVPKSMLRLNQHHLFAVDVMPRIDSSYLFDTYKLRFVYKSRPYICEVRSMIQYDSVSLFLCCDQNVRTGHTQRAQFTLLHPTNPSMNHVTNLYATFTSGSRKGQGSGVKKWMNRSQFLSYCMYDSIAAGLSSLYNSATDSGVDESQCYESSSSTSGRDDTDSNSSSSHASSDPYI